MHVSKYGRAKCKLDLQVAINTLKWLPVLLWQMASFRLLQILFNYFAVLSMQTGKMMSGTQHFFSTDIRNIEEVISLKSSDTRDTKPKPR